MPTRPVITKARSKGFSVTVEAKSPIQEMAEVTKELTAVRMVEIVVVELKITPFLNIFDFDEKLYGEG